MLARQGLDGLIESARLRRPPLHLARGDILLAAGLQQLQLAPDKAARLNQVLLDMLPLASEFERAGLAHAAAELAVYRCDGQQYDKALAFIEPASALHYEIWRARFKGTLTGLPQRIREEAIAEDTRHVRQVLTAYRLILEQGYCTSEQTVMPD